MDRTQRYRLPRLAIAPALFVALGFVSSHAQGQSSERFSVLVPSFTSQTDAKAKFGRDLAREVGKLLDEFPTHRQVDGKVLRDAVKKYGVKEEDLGTNNCIPARQLAAWINANLVMCGSFEGTRNNYTVKTTIIAPAEGETYELKAFQANDPKVAAQEIAQEFQGWIEGLLVASYCAQYVESQNWPSAIENCGKAVESTPSKGRIYMLSYAQWQSGDRESAYNGFKRVLEIEALHQESIKALGILATEMGRPDEGMKYFRDYIDLNPGDRLVRLTVASDAAKANQYEAALSIVEDGLKGEDANNIDLLGAAGVYAMNAANQKIAAAGGAMTPEATAFFEKSLTHLDMVYAAKGPEMDVSLVRNIIQANRLIGKDDAAVAFAEKIIAEPAYASDAGLWSVYADALSNAGRQAEAFAALDKAEAIDPDYAVNARRASWRLDTGDVEGAVPAIRTGLRKNEISPQQADVLAQKIAVAALDKAKANQFQVAIQNCDIANEFASSTNAKTLIAYVKGFAIYSVAAEREKPETLATAQATLPMFLQVLQLMNAAAGNPQVDVSRRQIIDRATQYVDIQQAIIKRGR
jgi:tetratricopeptide (TPR) repeat protein